ncbi:MAG: hypothetical protein ACK4QL_09760 [Pseudanabaenaceae cyanobacterium]
MQTLMDPQLPEIAKSPVLQAALDGLDVTLHAELERYRHWCDTGRTVLPRPPKKAPPEPIAPAPEPTVHEVDLSAAIVRTTANDITTPETTDFSEADLQQWAEDYQQKLQTPVESIPTQLEVSSPPESVEEKADMDTEEDFSIGIAGLVAIAVISCSSVAVALLLFDPFNIWRRRPEPDPTPAPAPQTEVVPTTQPVVDRDLMPSDPPFTRPPVTPTPTRPAVPTPPPTIVAVPIPAPTTAVAPRPTPTTTVTPTPTPTATVATPSPTPEFVYIDPQSPTPNPVPTAVITVPPPADTGDNFAVVTDPIYKDYVSSIVQPIERPSDGKIQLGAYPDAATANQKAEEWRRYGVPAVVVPR